MMWKPAVALTFFAATHCAADNIPENWFTDGNGIQAAQAAAP